MKMCTGIFSLLFLSSLFASEPLPESTSLSSASADYNGNTLVLKGNVVLDHGLGKMMAEQAFLEKQETGKDFPFSFIRLQNDVRVQLPSLAELLCEKADLDFVSLKGVLHPKANDKVTYIDNVNKNVRLIGDAIELEMSKHGYDGKKTAYEIESILAKGDVIVDYSKIFTLRADHALFRKEENEEQASITAFPKDENSACTLTHEGDVIEAEKVHVDLAQSRLVFEKPHGTLLSCIVPHVQKAEIAFSANQLLWDHTKNSLLLRGDVHIKESSLGTIDSDGTIQILQMKQKGKRVLKSIRSQGKTVMRYNDLTSNSEQELISHGPFLLDREHLRVSIESPQVNGVVPEGSQISYKESEISVFADKAHIEYALVEETLQPVSITLKGNVRLLSHNADQPALCGISDRIVFSPATKTLILSANPSKKVLFWDEAQGLRVSSQEIHVTQDSATKQRAVKGVGNVKFAFTAEENSLLHKLFPIYKVQE